MSIAPTTRRRVAPARAVTRNGATGMAVLWRRLGLQEARRRFWHMSPGLLPLILWPIPHRDPLSPILLGIIVGLFFLLTGLIFWRWRAIARAGVGDADRMTAIYGYATSVLATLFLLPAHPECGLALLGLLAFGDGGATLVGKLVGGPRLPWNPTKTYAGLCGFFLVGLPMTAAIYWGESNNLEAIGPPATVAQSVLIAAAGVAAGAIAESLRSRVNDNIRVGISGAAAIVTTHALLIGL